MRNIYTLILLFVIANSYSQLAPPGKISYRAVAMNGSTVLTNAVIGVKINILQGTSSGTSVYEQVFKYKTDGNGQYSFFIGSTDIDNVTLGPIMSTTINSGTILGVSWASSDYFLKVSLDPAGGTSYTAVGTTQLASVPYALYSKGAEKVEGGNGEIVKNIIALKQVKPKDKKLVYVQGYYDEGDGGGGYFTYKALNTEATNWGTIFNAADSTSVPGRWVRDYSGYMDVRYFGVRRAPDVPGAGANTNSKRLQNMIDYATQWANPYAANHNTKHDLTIFFPNGKYFIEKTLLLQDRVHIIGGSEAELCVNSDFNGSYIFELGAGPVAHILMESLWINCNTHGPGGIHIKPNGNGLAGLWDSSFRNINITYAAKPAIWLEGAEYETSGLDFSKIIQTLIFDNVRATRWNDQYQPCLKLTGYNANITFINSEFTNNMVQNLTLDGSCIYIGSTKIAPQVRQGSYAVSFINCGMGSYSRYGAVIENSSTITFDTGFYEGLDIAFLVKDSQQVRIVNNRFANASAMGGLTSSHLTGNEVGALVFAENSIVSVSNNNAVISAADTQNVNIAKQYFIVGAGSNNVFDLNTNSFKFYEMTKTQNAYKDIPGIGTPSPPQTIEMSNQKFAYLTTPASYSSSTNDLHVIKSNLGPGENLVIRANSGVVKFISMGVSGVTGKNIFLPPGTSSITLQPGHTATFVRIEDTFQLISTY